MMKITPSVAGGALFLDVAGRLDYLTSPDFAAQCQQLTGANQQKVVLKLDRVDYVSSAGVRAILEVRKAVQNGGGVLVLCGVQRNVKNVMEVAGLGHLLPMYDSTEAALESR